MTNFFLSNLWIDNLYALYELVIRIRHTDSDCPISLNPYNKCTNVLERNLQQPKEKTNTMVLVVIGGTTGGTNGGGMGRRRNKEGRKRRHCVQTK